MDKILVIDDIQQNVELMVTYLRNADYDVITANDGISGIKKAKTFKPDLIVLDLIMPKMSGFDVCKTLREDEETKDIIILIVTAMPSKESRNRSFRVGADEYMEKNFDKGMFLAKIKSLLRVKSLSDKLKENYAVLEEQNKQFEMQLEMARHVQSALVGEIDFSFENISFISKYIPAQEVSGDLYDVINLNSSNIAVFLADVSGHGVSAALLTSMIKIMFRNVINVRKGPDQLLEELNEQFCKIFEGSSVMIYACAFYAVFNLKEKRVRYSSAGAVPPVFLDASERTVQELAVRGRPLGMMSDSHYSVGEVAYDTGDLLLFQTDGLGDSLYKGETEVFSQKLAELLLDLTDKENPVRGQAIIDHVLNQFYNMKESAKYENDDISLILCEIE